MVFTSPVFPKLDYEGVIILGVSFGSLIFVILYSLGVLRGAPQNAYELAFLERAEKVCQTSVDYNFRFEPKSHALPGEMIGRQVLSGKVGVLRSLAVSDATEIFTNKKAECDRLILSGGSIAGHTYFDKKRYDLSSYMN